MGAAKRHDVVIDGKDCVVHTVLEGKTWTAYGSFGSRHITEKGRTESAALDQWIRHANYTANE
jgi:hypothetical protein